MTDLNRVKKVCLPFVSRRLSMTRVSSISQELKECNKDPETSGLHVQLVCDDDLLHWKGQILGPVGTPYEGGKFAIDIVLPGDYPFVPPKVRATPA